jgi:hypothetical protein
MLVRNSPLLSNWKYVLALPGRRFYNIVTTELCILCWTNVHLGVSAVGTPSVSSKFLFSKRALPCRYGVWRSPCVQHRGCVSAVEMEQRRKWSTGDRSMCICIWHRLQSTVCFNSILQHTARFKILSRRCIHTPISMLQILDASGRICISSQNWPTATYLPGKLLVLRECRSVGGWGTMLHAGRSWIWFQVRPLDF